MKNIIKTYLYVWLLGNAYSANTVPVIHDEKFNQIDVYDFIIDNSFITSYRNEKKDILDDEKKLLSDGFISRQISDFNFIPKSLYQLFVYDYYFNTIKDLLKSVDIENKTYDKLLYDKVMVLYNTQNENGAKFSTERFYKKNVDCGFDIYNYCETYNKNEIVKKVYWDINSYISDILKSQKFDEKNIEASIKTITKILIDNIIKNRKQMSELIDLPKDIKKECKEWHIENMREIMYMINICKFDGKEVILGAKNRFGEQFADFLSEIFYSEYSAPIDTYRIYRGEQKSLNFINEYEGQARNSFSDGLFSGIIHDQMSGCAFGYFSRNKNMICLDISKEYFKNDSESVFYLPNINIFGATMHAGEYGHPRTKKSETCNIDDYSFQGFGEIEVTKDNFPMYYTSDISIENFRSLAHETSKLNENDYQVRIYEIK